MRRFVTFNFHQILLGRSHQGRSGRRGNATHREEMRNSYRILVGNLKEKDHRKILLKYNKEIEFQDVDCIHLAQHRDRWRLLGVLRFHKICEFSFLADRLSVSYCMWYLKPRRDFVVLNVYFQANYNSGLFNLCGFSKSRPYGLNSLK
jgi:hypothetical protein